MDGTIRGTSPGKATARLDGMTYHSSLADGCTCGPFRRTLDSQDWFHGLVGWRSEVQWSVETRAAAAIAE